MDRYSKFQAWASYAQAALALGVLWYGAFLIPAGWRESATANVAVAPCFAVVALIVATLFRRKILASKTWTSDLLMAVALPSAVIAVVAVGAWIGAVVFGERVNEWPMLFMYPVIALYVVFVTAWYVIIPMGLVSQLVMKAVGRRAWPENVI